MEILAFGDAADYGYMCRDIGEDRLDQNYIGPPSQADVREAIVLDCNSLYIYIPLLPQHRLDYLGTHCISSTELKVNEE